MQANQIIKTKSKKISTLIITMLLAMMMAVPVSASTDEGDDTSDIGLRFTYFAEVSCGMDINSKGKATCSGSGGVYNKNDLVLSLKLYKHDGSYWRLVDSWTKESENALQIGTTEYSYDLESGYDYRLNTTCRVYDSSTGKLLETVTVLSDEVYY